MKHEEGKLAAIGAIAAHLREHGPTNWKVTREKFPDISEAHWWRLVKKVREGKSPEEILAGAIKKAKRAVARHLPAAPSPEYIAKGGSQAMAKIDFMASFDELRTDLAMLRRYALNSEGTAIKNPVIFAQAAKLFLELANTQIRCMREVYDLETQKRFYEAIVDEIAKESPDCARRIMRRLARLNAERGVTIFAGTDVEPEDRDEESGS